MEDIGHKTSEEALKESSKRAQINTFKKVSSVFAALGLLWFTYWLCYARFVESTDDAYTNAHVVTVNPVVPGTVISLYADDTDFVREGQLLVKIDPTPYELKYKNAVSELISRVFEVKQLYSSVKASQADVESKKGYVQKAQSKYENRLNLVGLKAVSGEEFTDAQNDLLIAQKALLEAEYKLRVAKDAIGDCPIEKHPSIELQRGVIRQAFYEMQHCLIYAPIDGYIAQRSAEVGQNISFGRSLMTIIPKDQFWVDANFKETQLSQIRVGQKAQVTLDLYGKSAKYQGTVTGISPGTGSRFSLIPPQNATGNWIKIVQRLPVRISLDQKTLQKYPARVGLSAQVNVDVSDQDFPLLQDGIREEGVKETSVLSVDFEEVDQMIDQLVAEYLNSNQQ